MITMPVGYRVTRTFIASLMVAAIALPAAGLMPPIHPAEAQERRSILDLFFGRPRPQQRPPETYDDGSFAFPEPPRQVPPQQPPRPRRAKAKPSSAATEPTVVEKLEDAKTVMVVGDFMAGALSDGLTDAFAETPGIRIENRSDGSSGLVRDDYFDWPNMLPVYAHDVKPALVVIALGANDRQQMKIGAAREKFLSDTWTADYTRRVAGIAAQTRNGNIPLIWVGQPSFQSTSMSADMVTLNGIFRTETEKAGGQFIDIWDGFVDEAGKFVTTGSDINGQQVRLRGADGIGLTPAGKRKLAFYVEKDIRRLLGEAARLDGDIPDPTGMKDLVVTAPTSDTIVRTQPISLIDPDLDGGATLLDGASLSKGNGRSARDLLVEKGEVAPPPPGRVDDFRAAKTPPPG